MKLCAATQHGNGKPDPQRLMSVFAIEIGTLDPRGGGGGDGEDHETYREPLSWVPCILTAAAAAAVELDEVVIVGTLECAAMSPV